jgi:hypothetical protein
LTILQSRCETSSQLDVRVSWFCLASGHYVRPRLQTVESEQRELSKGEGDEDPVVSLKFWSMKKLKNIQTLREVKTTRSNVITRFGGPQWWMVERNKTSV